MRTLKIVKKSHVSSFANKRTCSLGKTETETYSDTYLSQIVTYLNSRQRAKCAILVGHPSGLKRHLKRMASLGYRQKDVVIFEWCPKLARKLKAYVFAHGLKCQVIEGDLIGGVDKLCRDGYKFNYIEFDSVQTFGTQEPRLYRLVSKWNIPILITQGSGRGQSDWFKSKAKLCGAKRYENHGFKCYKLEDSADKIINRSLKGYHSHLVTYGGRETVNGAGKRQAAPMYMAISIKLKH